MKIVWAIIAAVIVIGGGWYYWSTQSTGSEAPTETGGPAAAGNTMPVVPQAVVVNYTDEGFSPKSVSVPQETTVSFVNMTSHDMWVASAKHPTHEVYDGTTMSAHCKDGAPTTDGSFDQCATVPVGESWQFTFDKVGTWNYHNHSRATDFGSVVVTTIATTTGDGSVSI